MKRPFFKYLCQLFTSQVAQLAAINDYFLYKIINHFLCNWIVSYRQREQEKHKQNQKL